MWAGLLGVVDGFVYVCILCFVSCLGLFVVEYFQDVDNEMAFLRDLVDTPRIVTYQENQESYSVIVENVQWEALDDSNIYNRWDWEGTATVIMRSVA